MDAISGFPYEIYYFSRNMEHVIHDIQSGLTDEEKEELAFQTADHYSDVPEEFLKFLYDPAFHVPGTYKDTWNFVMESGNSLKRYSNMALFFEKLGIEVNDIERTWPKSSQPDGDDLFSVTEGLNARKERSIDRDKR